MSAQLSSLPEELLERIIALATLPSPASAAPSSIPRSQSAPFPSRPFSTQPFLPRTNNLRASTASSASRPVHRYTPLLTNTAFARIGTAVLYTHVHLTSSAQCASLAQTLSARPELAQRLKSLRIDGSWPEFLALAQMLRVPHGSLEAFDMTIGGLQRGGPADTSSDVTAFCAALAILPELGTIKSLTVRKTSDTYLTLPGPVTLIECLSNIVAQWQTLQTVHIGFRLPSGPRRQTITPARPADNASGSSPCVKLVAALSRAPALQVVSTQLPAAWNSSLLEISSNPFLTAIKLEPSPPVAGPHHLFLVEASKYSRLDELIRAGSPQNAPPSPLRKRSETVARLVTPVNIGRARANTTAVSPPSSSITFPADVQSSARSASSKVDKTCPPTDDEDSSASGPENGTAQKQLMRRRSGKGHYYPFPLDIVFIIGLSVSWRCNLISPNYYIVDFDRKNGLQTALSAAHSFICCPSQARLPLACSEHRYVHAAGWLVMSAAPLICTSRREQHSETNA
ncbi:hypothetical protein BDW22DRAFT_1419624 [Trametopsis cervina]|nr:hypothetical protein BDW22DRAFT_1419624 [Trametopsis cervina]